MKTGLKVSLLGALACVGAFVSSLQADDPRTVYVQAPNSPRTAYMRPASIVAIPLPFTREDAVSITVYFRQGATVGNLDIGSITPSGSGSAILGDPSSPRTLVIEVVALDKNGKVDAGVQVPKIPAIDYEYRPPGTDIEATFASFHPPLIKHAGSMRIDFYCDTTIVKAQQTVIYKEVRRQLLASEKFVFKRGKSPKSGSFSTEALWTKDAILKASSTVPTPP